MMPGRAILLAGVLAFAFASGRCVAQNPVPMITEGMPITVELAKDVNTGNMGQGDPVEFYVSDDIYSTDGSHTLIVAKHAIAMGRVIRLSKAFDKSLSGKLTFTCEYAIGVNGRKVWLRGTAKSTGSVKTEIEAKHSGPDAALSMAIMSSAIGYKAGTQFTVYVDQDVLPVAPVASQ